LRQKSVDFSKYRDIIIKGIEIAIQKGESMYRVLEAERILHGKTREDLAKASGMNVNTYGHKLNDKSNFTIKEAKLIQAELGTDKTLDELFSDE